jgi:hypothetical protein
MSIIKYEIMKQWNKRKSRGFKHFEENEIKILMNDLILLRLESIIKLWRVWKFIQNPLKYSPIHV